MSENQFLGLAIGILIICAAFFGFRIYGKFQLCENYYSEMNIVACMVSDVIMPPQKR